MRYKNTSLAKKTFWGVTFKAGETKEVSGYINDPTFIRMPDTAPVSKQEVAKPATNTAPSKKVESPKVDPPKEGSASEEPTLSQTSKAEVK